MREIIALSAGCLFVVVLLSGCAPWQLVSQPTQWKNSGLRATLPQGWMRFRLTQDLLFLSQDGELLDGIRVYRMRVGKEKELPLTKKKFEDSLLPQEIAQLIVDELSSDQNRHNFNLIENAPAIIGGRPGFRLTYAFSQSDGTKYQDILCGFKEEKFVYLLHFDAARQYYYGKTVKDFERFVGSFSLKARK